MRMSEAAAAIEGELLGGDEQFSGVSTDTRTLSARQLFVAIKGPRFDAHDMLAEALGNGAVGAVVERVGELPLTYIRTTDARAALGKLASSWRSRFSLPVVAVTGSSGKTTVKEMLAAIIQSRATVLATAGNLNNDIGVPLTLLDLGSEHDFAVIEMGANRVGDIANLARIARPNIGVVTMCAPAHLEGFGDIATVARTKGEMFAALAGDGTAVLNADDAFAPMWRQLAGGRRIVEFGCNDGAEVRADAIVETSAGVAFRMHTQDGACDVQLAFYGRHNAYNALAAAACALALDFDISAIKTGLERAKPVPGRLNRYAIAGGMVVLDDTYNANPESLGVALQVLAQAPAEKWLVLGDMKELGAESERFHREAGGAARAAGVERLFTIGDQAQLAAAAFGGEAQHYATRESLTAALRAQGQAGVTVLLKGSRTMLLDEVATALAAKGGRRC